MQIKIWEKLEALHGAQTGERVLESLCKWLDTHGALATLRHGFKCYGRTLRVAFFKAAHDLNPELEARYAANPFKAKATLEESNNWTKVRKVIDEGDKLIDVQICDATSDVVLATREGMSIRFHQGDVRDMGRVATGVKGIELVKDDAVIGMVVIRRDATLLVVSGKGFGKRSELTEYRVQKRGGKGIITFKVTDKTGPCVALKEVQPDDELMMITRHGIIIRVPVDGIRVIGRNTQGVRVMNLDAGDTVVDVSRVAKEDESGSDEVAGEEVPSAEE